MGKGKRVKAKRKLDAETQTTVDVEATVDTEEVSARTTWFEVIELAGLLDTMIIQVASGTLYIKENKELADKHTAATRDEISAIASGVTTARESLIQIMGDLNVRSDTEVSENDYPKYLMKFDQLSDVKDTIYSDIMPRFQNISLFALDNDPKKDDKAEAVEEEAVNDEDK